MPRRNLAPTLGITLLLASAATPASAQTGAIAGMITDSRGNPLDGAQVMASTVGLSAESGDAGTFRIAGVPSGRYDLKIHRIGFKPVTVSGIWVSVGEDVHVDIRLQPTTVQLDGVVVTASRRLEKITDAPATITAVDGKEIGAAIGDSYTPALKAARGLAFNQVGVTSVFVNARGFDAVFNTRMLMIEDGRIAVLAESGLPVGPHTTIPKVDLDGVEVLVGPGSALYGPNASNGVIALRTKDPRRWPGWLVDVSGGTRNFYDVQARYAGVARRWGYKIAGEYQAADDWTDEVYYPAVVSGGSPIREKGTDYHTNVARVSGSLSRYFEGGGRLQLTSGMSERNALGKTSLGRSQLVDYRYRTHQVQYSGARWFAQAYVTHSNTGRTLNLNTFAQSSVRYPTLPADSIIELARFPADGRLHAAEIQNNFSVGMVAHTGITAVDNAHVIWGAQFRRDRVSSYGRQFSDRLTGRPILIDGTGGYVQIESPLSQAVRLVVAGRYDKHSRYRSQLSPKAALLLASGERTLRLSYAKAYRAPNVLSTVLYYPHVQPNVGVFGNVDGFDVKDGTGAVVKAYPPLRPETNETWEVGFKAVLREQLYADVTAYHSKYGNFLTNAAVIANPFAPSPTTAYNQRTGAMVTDENGQRLVTLSFFNVGEATSTGIDAGMRYSVADRILASTSITIARLNSVKTSPGDPPDATGFNTSPARITGSVEFTAVPNRASQAISVRYVNGYDFRGGVHYGHIPSFASLDLGASYRLVRSRTTLVVQAQNLFTCVAGTVIPPASGISPTAKASYVADRRCGFGQRHHELLNMPAVGAIVFLGVRWDGTDGSTNSGRSESPRNSSLNAAHRLLR